MPGRAVVWPTDPSGAGRRLLRLLLLLCRLGCLLLGLACGEVALRVRVVEVGGRSGLLGSRQRRWPLPRRWRAGPAARPPPRPGRACAARPRGSGRRRWTLKRRGLGRGGRAGRRRHDDDAIEARDVARHGLGPRGGDVAGGAAQDDVEGLAFRDVLEPQGERGARDAFGVDDLDLTQPCPFRQDRGRRGVLRDQGHASVLQGQRHRLSGGRQDRDERSVRRRAGRVQS